MSIAALFGYDKDNTTWKKVRCSENGHLGVGIQGKIDSLVDDVSLYFVQENTSITSGNSVYPWTLTLPSTYHLYIVKIEVNSPDGVSGTVEIKINDVRFNKKDFIYEYEVLSKNDLGLILEAGDGVSLKLTNNDAATQLFRVNIYGYKRTL